MWMGKVGDYQPVDLEPLRGANWFPLDGDSFELLPGIDLMWAGGHTPGSMMMRVATDAGNNYIFTGDFIHLPAELETESKGWLLADADEFLTGIRRLQLLAKRPNSRLVISHDPKLWEKYPKAPKYIE
jgi:glyoxylase-like metal-dependent hydrolase (beta-lactamase superfamily II)